MGCHCLLRRIEDVSDIKLIRTDTTLDLSQKAEKRYRVTARRGHRPAVVHVALRVTRVPAHSRSPFLCLVDSALAALDQTLEQKLCSPHCKRETPHLPWLCGSRAEEPSQICMPRPLSPRRRGSGGTAEPWGRPRGGGKGALPWCSVQFSSVAQRVRLFATP